MFSILRLGSQLCRCSLWIELTQVGEFGRFHPAIQTPGGYFFTQCILLNHGVRCPICQGCNMFPRFSVPSRLIGWVNWTIGGVMILQEHCSSILLQYLEQCAETSVYLNSVLFGNINTIYWSDISVLRRLCTPALQPCTDIQCFGCSQPLFGSQSDGSMLNQATGHMQLSYRFD
jgi:hypothetical protein